MVRGSISFKDTPPRVTMASLRGRKPWISTEKSFSTESSALRWGAVTEWHRVSPGMPDRSTTRGMSFWGSSSSREFAKILFLWASSSRRSRASSLPSSRAGFKSMCTVYFPGSMGCRWAEALKMVGPDSPKWVNSSSPKSWYTGFFFPAWVTFTPQLRRERPMSLGQSSPLATRGTREGSGSTTRWPAWEARR